MLVLSGGDVTERIERLYRSRYDAFCRMAMAVTGDLERAHEAAQDGFVRAYAAGGSFRGDGSLEAWVWKIILRSAIDARPAGAPIAGLAEAAAAVPFPDRDSALASALLALSPRRRLMVFLRYWAGTVSATLTQARAALRASLEVESGRTP